MSSCPYVVAVAVFVGVSPYRDLVWSWPARFATYAEAVEYLAKQDPSKFNRIQICYFEG